MTLTDIFTIIGSVASCLALIPLYGAYKRYRVERKFISVDEFKVLLCGLDARKGLGSKEQILMELAKWHIYPLFSEERRISERFCKVFSGGKYDVCFKVSLKNFEEAYRELQ